MTEIGFIAAQHVEMRAVLPDGEADIAARAACEHQSSTVDRLHLVATATSCAKYGLTPSCDFSSGCHSRESDRPLSAQCGLDRSSQRGISAFRVPGRRTSERIGPFVASGACAIGSVSADLLVILSPWGKFTLQKSDCQGHASRHSCSNEGTANGSPCGGTAVQEGAPKP